MSELLAKEMTKLNYGIQSSDGNTDGITAFLHRTCAAEIQHPAILILSLWSMNVLIIALHTVLHLQVNGSFHTQVHPHVCVLLRRDRRSLRGLQNHPSHLISKANRQERERTVPWEKDSACDTSKWTPPTRGRVGCERNLLFCDTEEKQLKGKVIYKITQMTPFHRLEWRTIIIWWNVRQADPEWL